MSAALADFARQVAIVGDEGLAALGERRLDDGMAPALDRKAQRTVDMRARPVAFDREFGERRGDVDFRKRGAEPAQHVGLARGRLPQPLENLELEAERAIGGRGDARFQIDQRMGGEAHRARHGLAVNEGRRMRRLQQRSRPAACGRLEVIAEEIVVLDLELAHARLFGVARLHFGDHAPALVAQARAPRRAQSRALRARSRRRAC